MKKYKVIVFDMDGTLYDLEDVISMNYQMQCDFLVIKQKISKKGAASLLNSNGIYPEIREDSKSCTEFFEQLGYDKAEWNSFREEHFDENFISREKFAVNSVLEEFTKNYILILLTSNSKKNVYKILAHLDISVTNFREIICSDSNKIDMEFNKKKAFQYILDNYKVQPNEILSIGDRFMTDIQPLLMIGGSGILIKKPGSLTKLHNDLLHNCLNSCQYYKFYCHTDLGPLCTD
ncbi:HAD family hydrolase [Lachnospiraceae bacterium 48-42]|nr:HAD family hydrolase [Lachnospiraceae bacterium]